MGGSKSKEADYLDPQQFEDLSEMVRPNKLYGEPKVYRQLSTGQMISVNHYNFADSTEFGQAELEARKAIDLQHDSLIKLLSVGVDKNDQFCGQSFDMQVIFEYLDNNLRQDIIMRQQRGIQYDESELWHILVSIIAALALLKSRGFSHQDIRPTSILINQENKVKIFPNLSFQKNYNGYMEYLLDAPTEESLYLSPAQLEALKTRQQKPIHIPSKTDIYNLAVTTVEAALLEKQDAFYDMNNVAVSNPNIESALKRVRQKYSQTLHDFLEKMLIENQDARFDVDMLFQEIERLCTQNHLAVADRLFTLQQPPQQKIEPVTHTNSEPKMEPVQESLVRSPTIKTEEIKQEPVQLPVMQPVQQKIETSALRQEIPVNKIVQEMPPIRNIYPNFNMNEIDELIRSSQALLHQNNIHDREVQQDYLMKSQWISTIHQPTTNYYASTVNRSPQVSGSQYRILNTVTQPVQTIEKVVRNDAIAYQDINLPKTSQVRVSTPTRTSNVIHTQTVKIVPQVQTSQVYATRQSGINVVPQRNVIIQQEPQTVYTSTTNQPYMVTVPGNAVVQQGSPVKTSQIGNQVRTSQITKLVQI